MNIQRSFRSRLLAALALLCFVVGNIPLYAQQSRLLQSEDLFSLKEVQELRLSPDGRDVIFTFRETNLKEDRNVNTTWRITSDGKSQPTRLTDSDKDSSPQWAPDG